ncbi:RluA family pseudouridine synthase [Virgibacillus sp. 179-BFC.A HS]|uniref:Pseudouridine synthase n=2 Tax=Tigheibacillus jepli TaxID=3035914 RepID=A0ABU5CL07_9BACI|nr:RluA family pseudouridine synthase [Virgibacillus sp. 179-BFC.A HS]MDY0406165.1 RluA family pseudouridine synthase [Virgibacillus sp. 179-BFC.A HS]
MTIRDFLKQKLHFSRRLLKTIKETDGAVLVNGCKRQTWEKLYAGDVIRIVFPEEEKAAYLQPQQLDLDIVYEDDAVLVINKCAGMAVIPSMNQPDQTVANGILGYYKQKGLPYTVHIVTRLDRDTSGLMLVAKHRYSHAILSEMQKQGSVRRKYLAIAEGELEEKQGTIDARIGRKEGSIIERTVTPSGQYAITHYKALQEMDKLSLLDVQLETGRTHQIRVHFASIGHPLAGDDLYGGSTELIARQALHSAQLTFTHPFQKEEMVFTSKLPLDMRQLME